MDPISYKEGILAARESAGLLAKTWKWVKSRYIPKAKRGTFGIAVAIASESDAHRPRLANDFIQTLRDLLVTGGLRDRISFVEIAGEQAAKIKGVEHALKLFHKTECVLMIWGLVRLRKQNKEPFYVLDIRCVVRHLSVPDDLKNELASEMTDVLAGRRTISAENDLEEFELNAASVDLAARYIIARAALLSGAAEFAQELYENVYERLEHWEPQSPERIAETVKLLKHRVPIYLAATSIQQARRTYLKWRKTRNQQLLDVMKHYLDKIEEVSPDFYDAWVLRALYFFAKGRDVEAAHKEINKCQVISGLDSAWIYFDAFLLAYEGKMIESRRIYLSVLHVPFDSSIVLEAEELMEWVLKEEPDKVQLHFCLGMINTHAKGDNVQAESHFRKFL
ncbi:MAG: hypothetical protein ACRD9S_09470 [Pyrinomonadaceae bacterium]